MPQLQWYDAAYVETFRSLDATVPRDLFFFLANSSNTECSLSPFAVALAGRCTLAELQSMSKDELSALGAEVGMPPAAYALLIESVHEPKPDSRFILPAEAPAYPYGNFTPANKRFRELAAEVFQMADSDGSGTLDFDELLEVFRSPDFVAFMLTNDFIDRDGSGTIDIHEWQDLLQGIHVQSEEAGMFVLNVWKQKLGKV